MSFDFLQNSRGELGETRSRSNPRPHPNSFSRHLRSREMNPRRADHGHHMIIPRGIAEQVRKCGCKPSRLNFLGRRLALRRAAPAWRHALEAARPRRVGGCARHDGRIYRRVSVHVCTVCCIVTALWRGARRRACTADRALSGDLVPPGPRGAGPQVRPGDRTGSAHQGRPSRGARRHGAGCVRAARR